jgi:hypothetical protein
VRKGSNIVPEPSNNFNFNKIKSGIDAQNVIAEDDKKVSGGTPSQENLGNQKKRRRNLIIGGIASAAALAITIPIAFGMSTQGQGVKPPKATESSAPANPVESSAPVNNGGSQETTNFTDKRDNFERPISLPAELAPLASMSLSDYELRPKDIQLEYASYLGQYRSEYMAWYYRVSGKPEDKPIVLTPTSSAEDLFRAHLYDLRMSDSMNLPDAEKFLVAHFDGTQETNNALKSQLDIRRNITIQSNQFTSKNLGDSIPASVLAMGDVYGSDALTSTKPTTFTNREGVEVNGFTYNGMDLGKSFSELVYPKTVKGFNVVPTIEVILNSSISQ